MDDVRSEAAVNNGHLTVMKCVYSWGSCPWVAANSVESNSGSTGFLLPTWPIIILMIMYLTGSHLASLTCSKYNYDVKSFYVKRLYDLENYWPESTKTCVKFGSKNGDKYGITVPNASLDNILGAHQFFNVFSVRFSLSGNSNTAHPSLVDLVPC